MQKSTQATQLQILNKLPFLSFYARSRGPSFLIFWAHRITGLILALYLLFHLLTLSSLSDPAVFTAKMTGFKTPFFTFLEFILAIPLLFHALNGLRLILYENFGCRDNMHLLHWLGSLGLLALLILGLLMGMGTQTISPRLYAILVLTPGLMLTAYLFLHIRGTPTPRFWKIQRLTAVFLLFALPGHMLFMHLNHALGHEAANILSRMQLPLMQIFYLLAVCCGLYHTYYGLLSILQDLLVQRTLRSGLTVMLVLCTVYFAFLGLRFTFFLA